MNWMKNFRCEGESLAVQICKQTGSLFTNAWVFLMLTVFPLYAPNQYFGLGEHKYNFFLESSLICLLPALAGFGAALGIDGWRILREKKREALGEALRRNCSVLDIAVLCYLAAVLLSYICSGYRQEAWIGADGWFMGLRTQLLLAAAYFCVSRARLYKKILLAGHFFGSGAACLMGVLHRFQIDPLGMYDGISESYFLEFLSTLGQATWFSSYLCTVLVIGIAYFYLTKNPFGRVLSGIYCMLGFAAVVTQNSDSAFWAMAVLILGLFCISCRNMDRMEQFLETLLLMLGSFKIVGILQQLFSKQALQLDALSEFMTQGKTTWFALLAVSVIYLLFQIYRTKHEQKEEIRCGRWLAGACAGGAGIAVAAYAVFVWLNTTGRLGTKIAHPYLLFDNAWGNFRGLIWSVSAEMYGQMNGLQKLVGAGPDCYWMYCYSNPAFDDRLSFWFGTNQIVTNAHNEFLNVLICLGIVGLAAFWGLLTAAGRRFLGIFGANKWQGETDTTDALVLAGGLAVLTYGAHNIFCYQQICCTPFLFLIMAAAENCLRRK